MLQGASSEQPAGQGPCKKPNEAASKAKPLVAEEESKHLSKATSPSALPHRHPGRGLGLNEPHPVRKLLQGCFCGAAQGAGRSRGWAALSWVQPSLLSLDRGLCSSQGGRAGAPHAAVGASASSRSLPAAHGGSGLLRCVIKLRLKLFGAGGTLQPRACGQIQGATGQGSEGKGSKTKAVSTQHSWAVLSRSPGAAVPQQAHKSPRQR